MWHVARPHGKTRARCLPLGNLLFLSAFLFLRLVSSDLKCLKSHCAVCETFSTNSAQKSTETEMRKQKAHTRKRRCCIGVVSPVCVSLSLPPASSLSAPCLAHSLQSTTFRRGLLGIDGQWLLCDLVMFSSCCVCQQSVPQYPFLVACVYS